MNRSLRIAAVALGGFGLLWLRFSAEVWPENEVSRVVHWGLLPIAFLLGFGAWALETSGSGSVTRRDALWGLSAGITLWALLRIAGGV